MENPNYYAIIPANIRYSKELSMFQKLLYAEITALTQKDGYCWASNAYFSELYGKTAKWISSNIADMNKKGFLEIYIDKSKGNLRKIYLGEVRKTTGKIVEIPILEKKGGYPRKLGGPIPENWDHNNIYNNKNNNNISKDILLGNKSNNFLDLLKVNIVENLDYIKKIKLKYNVSSDLLKTEIELFVIHWTEKNPNGKKEKWEMQKTFDIQRRFYTWMSNNKKWNSAKNNIQNSGIVLVDDNF